MRVMCGSITSHHAFDNFILCIIMLSALLLAVEGPPDATYIHDDVKTVIQIRAIMIPQPRICISLIPGTELWFG